MGVLEEPLTMGTGNHQKNFLKSRLAPCQTKIAKTSMVVELRTGWYVLREEIQRTPAMAIRVVRSSPKTPIPSSSSGLPVGGVKSVPIKKLLGSMRVSVNATVK